MPESQKAEAGLCGTDVAVSKEARAEETLKTIGRRLLESRMRENLTSGSMWQGMETGQGDGTEALSEEMESNGSATPKSWRHPLTLPEKQLFIRCFLWTEGWPAIRIDSGGERLCR